MYNHKFGVHWYKLIVFTTFYWETSDKLYNRVCPCFRDFAENNTP